MRDLPPDPPPFEPFPVVSSERVADNTWCGLGMDRIRLDDGSVRDHWVFDVAPSVVVVPARDDGSIVTIWQYRHPSRMTHWELPAGRIDEGEEQIAARALWL